MGNLVSVKWIYYNFLIAFALYWFSNLILWFPWSISPWFGMTLMLTVSPVIWGFGIFQSLIRYHGNKPNEAAYIVAVITIIVVVISDFVFFGIIRGAVKELYHPTTFYGYAFLITLPFLEILFFSKLIDRKKRTLIGNDFMMVTVFGIVSLLLLIVIIKLNIKII